eukprot:COSAG02_NODE_10968_length_1822_cov_1.257690_3_plen_98_part_01
MRSGLTTKGSLQHVERFVVDSRIAMYKVVNAAAQVESKSRLTGTAGFCLDLIDRISDYGIGILWALLHRGINLRVLDPSEDRDGQSPSVTHFIVHMYF